jgi:hypothetical protein
MSTLAPAQSAINRAKGFYGFQPIGTKP